MTVREIVLARSARAARVANAPDFDGRTYSPPLDKTRLTTQLAEVKSLMLDGAWWTIPDLTETVHGLPTAISARIRDFRKPKFGGHMILSARVVGESGLWKYRLIKTPEAMDGIRRLLGRPSGWMGGNVKQWELALLSKSGDQQCQSR